MNFIIYDIEATCWEGTVPGTTAETIEIGAVKMDGYGDVLSSFQRLIRPVIHPQLSHYCQQLTNISQVDINRAREFPEVIEDFQDWIDIWDKDYLLCAWGNFDFKMLQRDCERHRLDDEWLDPFLNLRRQYYELKRLRRPRGLKKSVLMEGFEWTGDHHRALADAQNLAKLFRKHIDEWQY